MSSILLSSGLGPMETLKEFSLRFPNLSTCFDNEVFEKVWLCHRTSTMDYDIATLNDEEEYSNLSERVSKRIKTADNVCQIDIVSIIKKIYHHFKSALASYILDKCYLFYNWGTDAFEILLDPDEIHKKIKQGQNKLFSLKTPNHSCHKNTFCGYCCISDTNEIHQKQNNIDVVESKLVSFKKFKKVIQSTKPFLNFSKNNNDPSHEEFDLNYVLYDTKSRPQWPENHILSTNHVDKLLEFIIQLESKSQTKLDVILENESQNWMEYKNFLAYFLKRHKEVEKYNGYGRILKRHLKSVVCKSNCLTPITSSLVASYIIDILRKVLPSNFYGSNRIRKNLFSSIVRIINGNLREKFIWRPFIQILLDNSSKLLWCSEMNRKEIKYSMILKTFKFIIVEFVFNVLKCNFYITETATSGYALRFYRKADMEKATKDVLNELLYFKHVKLQKRHDLDVFTMERKWVDTGVIETNDIMRKSKQTMLKGTEFKQPVASVRFLPKKDVGLDMRLITYISKRKSTNSFTDSHEVKELSKVFEARLRERNQMLFCTKLFLELLIDKFGLGIKPILPDWRLEAMWKRVMHLKNRHGELFFVKADIANAFDSVVHEKLLEVLQESAQKACNGTLQLLKVREWCMRNNKIVENVRFSFSSRPSENSILISGKNVVGKYKKLSSYSSSEFIDVLRQVAMQQRLDIGGRTFKLVNGLCQGSAGKFSPHLCELYYSHMDNLHFLKFINSDKCIFVRGVDDYLLVTSQKYKAEQFLRMVRCGIKDFNVRFNTLKLISNLIQKDNEVTYLGFIFNFENMSVRPSYSKYERKTLTSTMKLSDPLGRIHFEKNTFFELRVLRMWNSKLQPILLRTNFNDAHTIRQVFFQACMMQSARAMTLANYLYPKGNKNDLMVRKVLFRTCRRIKHLPLLWRCLNITEIHWLFLKAVIETCKKQSGQFGSLLLMMRFHLQKLEKKISGETKHYLNNLTNQRKMNDFLKCLIQKDCRILKKSLLDVQWQS